MSEFDVGFVIFPGITQLDFTGPFEVLSRLATPPALGVESWFADARTHVVAKTMAPVTSDRGLAILPTCTYADCPPLDLASACPAVRAWRRADRITRPSNSSAARRGGPAMSPRSASAPSCSVRPACCKGAGRRRIGRA